MIVEYVGLVEKVIDGYTLFFPDFPGCGSAGHNLEETRKNAREGLIAHIELMLEDEQSIPKPASLDTIIKSPEAKDCIPLIIGIILPSGKARRINITLDSELLSAIDMLAANQHKTRSSLLAEAAQQLLGTL